MRRALSSLLLLGVTGFLLGADGGGCSVGLFDCGDSGGLPRPEPEDVTIDGGSDGSAPRVRATLRPGQCVELPNCPAAGSAVALGGSDESVLGFSAAYWSVRSELAAIADSGLRAAGESFSSSYLAQDHLGVLEIEADPSSDNALALCTRAGSLPFNAPARGFVVVASTKNPPVPSERELRSSGARCQLTDAASCEAEFECQDSDLGDGEIVQVCVPASGETFPTQEALLTYEITIESVTQDTDSEGYCGDGKIGAGEQCDDRAMNGVFCAYAETSCQACDPAFCAYVPGRLRYCCDTIVQEEFEDCDPGRDEDCPADCQLTR